MKQLHKKLPFGIALVLLMFMGQVQAQDDVLPEEIEDTIYSPIEYHEVFMNEYPFFWRGETYNESGTYHDTTHYEGAGQDTIYTLDLMTRYRHQDTLHACQGDPVRTWRGQRLDHPGGYSDVYLDRFGNDSSYYMQFYIHNPVVLFDTIRLCQSEFKNFFWAGNRITKPGNYVYEGTSPYGCDSTVYMHLIILQSPPVAKEVRYFCQNEGFFYGENNTQYFEEMFFRDTLVADNGCDSITEYHYIPRPSFFHEDIEQHLTGESIEWHGKMYDKDGIYGDTLTNSFGCDSIYQLRLVTKYYVDKIVYRCAGDTAMLHKRVIETNCTINDTLKTKAGGDSIIRYTFSFMEPLHTREYVTICSNEYFEWEGHVDKDGKPIILHEEGVYYDRKKNKAGCEDVHEITVKHSPAYLKDSVVIVCNDSAAVKPVVWTDSKGVTHSFWKPDLDTLIIDTMRHTAPSDRHYQVSNKDFEPISGGCDSIFRLRVIISGRCSELERIPMCPGETLTIDGKKYTKPGVYSNTMPSKTHAHLNLPDSTHTFEIFMVQTALTERDTTIFESTLPYIFLGQTYNKHTSGSFDAHLKTIYGCDSVVRTHVNLIKTSYAPVESYLFCPNETFNIQLRSGRQVTAAGNYLDTIRVLSEVNSFDSIYSYDIRLGKGFFVREIAYVYEGTPFLWEGHERNGETMTFEQEGVYYDSCHTVEGCDSVYQLKLVRATPVYTNINLNLCSSELPYYWNDRVRVDSTGIYHDTLHTVFNLDSVITLNVNVARSYVKTEERFICEGSSFTWNNRQISKPGVYIDTLNTHDGCDSIVRLSVNYAPHYFLPETMSYVDDDSELPLSWRGKLLPGEGVYYDSLFTVQYGCDSIYQVTVIKKKSYLFEEERHICQSDAPITWHGKLLYQTGDYEVHYTTRFGLDSVYNIHFVVDSTYFQSHQITLCDGDTSYLLRYPIFAPGVYRDTLPTIWGCDSVIQVTVIRPDMNPTIVHHDLCEGNVLELNGRSFTTSGIYYEQLKSQQTGCDSVVNHIITFHHDFFDYRKDFMGEGETYIWHKNGQPWPLTQAGTYFDSCVTKAGCDSIYKLELAYKQSYIFPTEEVTICANDVPYSWHGKSLYTDTLCYDRLKTHLGADSIYSIRLKVEYARDSIVYDHYCDNETPTIHGVTYTRDGVYVDTLVSNNYCDSVYITHHLVFHKHFISSQLIQLRDGESLDLGDTVVTTSGNYTRYLKTAYGCDSIVNFCVITCPDPKDTTIYHDFCEGETVYFNGEPITNSCLIHYTFKTADKCDSIVHYQFNLHPIVNDTMSVRICRGDSYTWHRMTRGDTVMTRQGLFCDSILNAAGCYDLYWLKITYKRVDINDTIISLCEDLIPYQYKGKYYYTDSIFMDTLANNTEGCDSIMRWTYNINHHCSEYDQYTRCIGETVPIEGLLINKEGAYAVNRLTDDGQDSLYRFIVRDVPAYEKYYHMAPECDSIVYLGHTFYARGAGRESFEVDFNYKSIDGCDSIEHVTFTIYSSSPKNTHYATIADYETYRFENRDFKLPGTYPVRHVNRNGCDSIEELVLTVLTTQYPDPVLYTFCEGDKNGLEIFGKMWYPTTDTLISDTTSKGGVPIIRQAIVNKRLPFTITHFDPQADQEVCSANELMFYVNYTAKDKGSLPDYYDVDFFTGDVEASPKHQTHEVGGKTTLPIMMDGLGTSVNPGYYSYRITMHSDACTISDTSFVGTVLVRYPAEIMESNWGNVVALVNEDNNAGRWRLCPPYTWQIWSAEGDDKTALINATNANQPYIYSDQLQEGDRVVATLSRTNYPRPIPSCAFTFVPVLSKSNAPVMVYPTAAAKERPITIEAKQQGTYEVVNHLGHRCDSGTFEEGKQTIRTPDCSGCYILYMNLNNGGRAAQKIMVY